MQNRYCSRGTAASSVAGQKSQQLSIAEEAIYWRLRSLAKAAARKQDPRLPNAVLALLVELGPEDAALSGYCYANVEALAVGSRGRAKHTFHERTAQRALRSLEDKGLALPLEQNSFGCICYAVFERPVAAAPEHLAKLAQFGFVADKPLTTELAYAAYMVKTQDGPTEQAAVTQSYRKMAAWRRLQAFQTYDVQILMGCWQHMVQDPFRPPPCQDTDQPGWWLKQDALDELEELGAPYEEYLLSCADLAEQTADFQPAAELLSDEPPPFYEPAARHRGGDRVPPPPPAQDHPGGDPLPPKDQPNPQLKLGIETHTQDPPAALVHEHGRVLGLLAELSRGRFEEGDGAGLDAFLRPFRAKDLQKDLTALRGVLRAMAVIENDYDRQMPRRKAVKWANLVATAARGRWEPELPVAASGAFNRLFGGGLAPSHQRTATKRHLSLVAAIAPEKPANLAPEVVPAPVQPESWRFLVEQIPLDKGVKELRTALLVVVEVPAGFRVWAPNAWYRRSFAEERDIPGCAGEFLSCLEYLKLKSSSVIELSVAD